MNLGADFAGSKGAKPQLFTPDRGAGGSIGVRRDGRTIEFTLARLDAHSVVVLR